MDSVVFSSSLPLREKIHSHRSGLPVGVFAVCSSHSDVLRAAMRLLQPSREALLIEATCNQVNQEGGYTGMTPKIFSEKMAVAAKNTGFGTWGLHADHISIKKGDAAEVASTKELIDAQIAAGYTSFAIDASHLFNFNGKNVREELEDNIRITTEIAQHIRAKMGKKEFGLEVEVGEIGRKDTEGLVLTRPEEAVEYISALNENGVFPHVLPLQTAAPTVTPTMRTGMLSSSSRSTFPEQRRLPRPCASIS